MSQQSQPASFTNPFKWGKKKDEEKKDDKTVAAAPPPVVETPPAPAPAAVPAPPPVRTYTVRAGDTLWDIAVRYYGDGRKYTKISIANGIADPNMIDVGLELKIPG